jgi:hypothetical protein
MRTPRAPFLNIKIYAMNRTLIPQPMALRRNSFSCLLRHEPLGFKVKAKNPSGKRKSSPHDYGGKWTHAAAQDALAIKLEESSRGVVQGTRVKQETKWTRKQTEVEISGEHPIEK